MKFIAMVLVSATFSSVCMANLGESESEAKARATAWKANYNAIDPMFVNKNGKVVWECWAATSLLSQKKAMEFARNLLPKSLQGQSPIALPEDGTKHIFKFKDGTQVNLSGLSLDKVMSVEVCSPGQKCGQC